MREDTPHLWTDDERWQVLMDNIKDYGIFMLDADGKIATWNKGAERVLGFTSDEVIDLPFSRIFTPEDIEREQPEYEMKEAKEKGRCEDERWHVRKNGERFWASGVLTPLWTEDGTLRGFAKVVRDITDRKMSELSVADANRRKDEFLATLSHEFRSPLAAILNATELLKMDPQAEMRSEVTGIIERQAGTLTRMVNDLLDIARINGGKLSLHRERIELEEVLSQALEAAQPMIKECRHQLELNVSPDRIWIDGDGQRLSQIITNILVNAAKYTDQGGTISVQTKREGNLAFISVRDTGSGILSEMLPRNFEPFVQADRSLERSHGGLGLGLSLVKRITEMHGGKVEAFSEGIGKGSEFVLQLPAIPDAIAQESDVAENCFSASQGRKLSILLAEDNRDAADILGMILQKMGHSVQIVGSGTEALHEAHATKPDALILDIGLPGMDGYQVAETIRSQPEFHSMCLIALTGHAQPEDQQRAIAAGFNHHLVKPIDFDCMSTILREI